MIEIAYSINLVNFTSSCFTSYHHVLTNMIHDLTTLCASCHECFDYIKTLLHVISSIYRSLNRNTSSLRLVNTPSSRKRPTTLSSHKLYNKMFHISSSCDLQQDPWSHNFMRVMSRVFRLHQNFATHHIVDLTDHSVTSLRLESHRVVTQASCNFMHRHKTLYAYRSLIVSISLSH